MKKNIWVLGILGICLLTIAGCGTSSTQREQMDEQMEDQSNETTSEVNVAECNKGCDMLYEEEDGKLSCKEMCEAASKLSSEDIWDCDELANTGTVITKDMCIQGKAIDMKKPEYCEKIEDSLIKDTCYVNLAGEMEDTSLCENISNGLMKLGCEDTGVEEQSEE